MNARKNNPVQSLWSFFCSLKLTLFILIMLAVTSIIGTIIQQNRAAEEYAQEYGERLYAIFKALQFVDMYHSWWFLGLLVLFCLNLIACSVKRLPKLWKSVRQSPLVADESLFNSLGNVAKIDSEKGARETALRLSALLTRRFARPVVTEADGKIYLFAQKAPWARFGAYVTHLSILIIFVGAIIGNVWGFKGYVNIVEGGQVSKVWPRGGEEPIELGFSVRCDDFDVTYYDGTNRPKEFASILDVVDGGKEVVSDRKIIVNDPLSYNGITFYQSSYGPAGSAALKMRVTPKGGEPFEVDAEEGEHVSLPGGSSFAVTGYAPSYQGLGPAVQMHINTPDGGHGKPIVIFQNHPDFDGRRGGDFAFALLEYEQRQYTGLQVKKDPGVWVVWLGCLLMVLGTMAAFMISHRRIWVAIEPAGDSCAVRIGGSAHRNQAAFALYFETLEQDLADELGV